MSGWSYFRILSVLLGSAMLAEAAVFTLLSDRSRRTLVDLCAPPEGPAPIALGSGLLYLVWLGDLWRRALSGSVPHGWVLAAILSLGLVKVWAYCFRYQGFRRWLRAALCEPRRLRGLCLSEALAGGLFLLLGVTLY